jgi:hypothetical protein
MRCMGVHIASATSGERPEKLIMDARAWGKKMQKGFVYKPIMYFASVSVRESSLTVTWRAHP